MDIEKFVKLGPLGRLKHLLRSWLLPVAILAGFIMTAHFFAWWLS